MRKAALIVPVAVMVWGLNLVAQTPSKSGGMQAESNLNQLMRGVLYPAANVVFSAQTDDPGKAKPVPGTDPSMATDPLLSTFGGWVAVENAALTLAESANLLMIPGRSCSNGVAVPLNDPDWAKFVQQLRDAGLTAYKAAQTKDQDKMIDVAETLTAACGGCHRKWREKRPAERCR